ncbi:hypothetical protein ALMP_57170 [Streptomyces sp. A012304]|nr:hypothetical protein ALMP_57170 [Streptomyces sp. A012304]
MDGATATAAIRAAHPEVRVVVLTTYDTDADITSAIDAGAVVGPAGTSGNGMESGGRPGPPHRGAGHCRRTDATPMPASTAGCETK